MTARRPLIGRQCRPSLVAFVCSPVVVVVAARRASGLVGANLAAHIGEVAQAERSLAEIGFLPASSFRRDNKDDAYWTGHGAKWAACASRLEIIFALAADWRPLAPGCWPLAAGPLWSGAGLANWQPIQIESARRQAKQSGEGRRDVSEHRRRLERRQPRAARQHQQWPPLVPRLTTTAPIKARAPPPNLDYSARSV